MKMVAYGTAVGPFCTLICFCCIFGTECFSGGSNSSISVKTGGSVTIPCYYDKKYTQQRKFWYSDIDNSRIYTNSTNGTVSVIDYPDESLFIVTMRHVKKRQRGDYGCYVEINEPSKNITTVIHEVHLDVKDAPDVSVMNSSVSGDEGGHISVQCLYSSQYKTRHKQWCRYRDEKCYTSQSSSVQIRDDGSESFTVTMSGLMLGDSSWYFCSVGDLQAPVQLTVTPKTVTEKNNNVSLWLPIFLGLLVLVILLGVFTWKWKRRSEKDKTQTGMRNNDIVSSTPEDPVVYSEINDENPNKVSQLDSTIDTTYSTIADPPGNTAESPAGGTIYTTVAPH